MIATGSSPDAFQATSYLDLCPLKCSLPSSPVESQWETAKSTLKALTLENPTTQLSSNDLRMSAVKCSNLRQPHHVLETFRPFLVKVTRAAQSDFGLVQLQVNRQLLLNWICLGVQRNRLCHTAGPVQLMQPNFPCGQLSRHIRCH